MSDERNWENDKPPQRIWLQWHDPESGEIAHPEERSWSDYRVSEGDPCYVRFGWSNAEQNRLLVENHALRQRAEAAEAARDALRAELTTLQEGWWTVGKERPDEGGLYIATIVTEYYDGAWLSEDHLIDLSRYVKEFRDAPVEDSDE